jgi:hypothetical protein
MNRVSGLATRLLTYMLYLGNASMLLRLLPLTVDRVFLPSPPEASPPRNHLNGSLPTQSGSTSATLPSGRLTRGYPYFEIAFMLKEVEVSQPLDLGVVNLVFTLRLGKGSRPPARIVTQMRRPRRERSFQGFEGTYPSNRPAVGTSGVSFFSPPQSVVPRQFLSLSSTACNSAFRSTVSEKLRRSRTFAIAVQPRIRACVHA